ncbi:MAG: hypothetical protein RL748_3786 [Pseudomonadota bacterium]|jgi:uncharacterized protein YcbX
MYVKNLWRYPVKSMGGEPLQRATLSANGIEGDRVVHAADEYEQIITSRSHPGLLGHKASLGPDGEPLVDGLPWRDPQVALAVRHIGGARARLRRYDGVERFDVLPLLVATDGAIEAFGHDYRRLRPNIVVGGVPGMAETGWPGRQLRIGEVLIGIQDLRARCIMTSFDPDTLVQDKDVTRSVYQRFNGVLALNCWVIEGGRIGIDDEVELV